MSAYEVPFRPSTMAPVIQSSEEVRAAFVVKVYQHVALAIAAFIGLEVALFETGLAEQLYTFVAGGGVRWLMLLGGVMLLTTLTGRAADQPADTGLQYVTLMGAALGQAIIFAPMLYYVLILADQTGDLLIALMITLVGFAGLTMVAFTTRRDLSFLRPIVTWGVIVALGLIVAAIVLDFTLGVAFSIAMVALMGASILYQTQNVIRRYPEWAYVAAAVGLFTALMTMFWYVLRLVSALRR